MAVSRNALRTFSLAAKPAINRCSAVPRASLQRPHQLAAPIASFSHHAPLCKSLPNGWTKGKRVTYDELKPITKQPSDDILLIDVREPDEVMNGNIPSSVNLPLSIFEQEMAADTGDFTRKNGFRKPAKDQPIIVYCRSGKRSQTALEALERHGYKHVRNYTGSYSDWAAKESQQ